MSDDDNYDIYWLAVFVVVFLWALSFVTACGYWMIGNVSEAGTFGDSFGAVNALFSGLAFAGVVIALIIQTKELQLARIERREALESQKELSRQAYFSSLAVSVDAWAKMAGQQRFSRVPSANAVHVAMQTFEYRRRIQDALDSIDNKTQTSNEGNRRAISVSEVARLAREVIEMSNFIGLEYQRGLLDPNASTKEVAGFLLPKVDSLSDMITQHHSDVPAGAGFQALEKLGETLADIYANCENSESERRESKTKLREAVEYCRTDLHRTALGYIGCYVDDAPT